MDNLIDLLELHFKNFNKTVKKELKNYFESVFTVNKKKIKPFNLVYFMGGIIVILFSIIITIGVITGRGKIKN
tara:strand:- start:58 stop:276 length:219 start_codon:yes stop_codon:yes gene_type:complete